MKVRRLSQLTQLQKDEGIREAYIVDDAGVDVLVEMLEDGLLDCAVCNDGKGCLTCSHVASAVTYIEAHPIVVIVVMDTVVSEIDIFDNVASAEKQFLDYFDKYVADLTDYTPEEVQEVLAQGYAKFFNGSVCMSLTAVKHS